MKTVECGFQTARVFDAIDGTPCIALTPDGTRVTIRLPVACAKAQLVGHYPGFPILPGVLLIDAARQAASFAYGSALRLCRIDRARFVRPMLPGDVVELSSVLAPEISGRIGICAQGVRTDGQLAVQLNLTLGSGSADA